MEEKDSLEKDHQAQGHFLVNMSHELRTPLNSILGFSQLLEKELGQSLSEKHKQYLQHISRNGEHLLGLVNDLLDFSSLEKREVSLKRDAVDLRMMLDQVLKQTELLRDEKSIALHCHWKDDVRHVFVDGGRCKQILVHLIGNALKFTPENGRVEVDICKQKDRLLIAVKDTGVGITSENLERVFYAFYQIDQGHNRTFGGTGLGLSLVKSLVELHEGKVWCESEGVGMGTCFYMVFPGVFQMPQDAQSLLDQEELKKTA